MNLPNKLTMSRIIIALIIMVLLLFPFFELNIDLPKYLINGQVVVELKYLIAGVLFIIASITDYFDGKIARKYNLVTDFGKMIDSIADKVLVNSILIILATNGFISPIIPVVIVVRDIIVNSIKMVVGNKGHAVAAIMSGKIKTACLMVGIVLTLFYNLPFELYNLRVADFLLVIATILSVLSGIQYYIINKQAIFENN